ncbi:MAG: SLC13 family permease [Cellulosilyticaceae bacterium]
MILLGFSGFAPMNAVINTAFGDPLAVLIMYVFILTGAINEEGICDYVARWFVTRKVINGRPWVFTFMILIGVFILSTLTLTTATILLFLPILYSLFKLIGFKKEDKYVTVMLISVVMVALLSFASTPFKSILPGLIKSFEKVTGETIEYLPYMMNGIVISLVSIVLIIGYMKYIIKPDVSKLKEIHVDMFNKDPLPKMNSRQKILIAGLMVFVMWMLVPSLLSPGVLKTFLASSQNAVPILIVVICCFIKLEDKPLLEFTKIFSKYMSWSVVLIVSSSSTLIGALTDESTGIIEFLEYILIPIFEGKSMMTFTILIMLICFVLTNLCNNMVVGMLFIPIIHIFTASLGESPLVVGVLMLFVVCLAIITPAGSATAAILHGNKEWLKTKEIYKYTTIMSLLILIVTFVVGIPLTHFIFK